MTPASSAICGPSANGKNASDASDGAGRVVAELRGLLHRDADGVDAAHLAGADPDRREVFREDDRVRSRRACTRATRRRGRPTAARSPRRRRRPSRPDRRSRRRVLDEHAAEHALVARARRALDPALAVEEDPRVLLLLQRGERLVAVAGREEDSTNCSASFSPRPSRLAVEDDDAAERADTGSDASALSYASSVVAPSATPHGFACLTITHAGASNSRTSARAPERSLRLLNESSFPWSCSTRERRWRRRFARRSTRPRWCGFSPYARSSCFSSAMTSESGNGSRREPPRDRGVVRGRRRERLRRETGARLERDAAGAQLREHRLVVGEVADCGDGREVLRRGAQHRRPADVDHLELDRRGRARTDRG